jgi:carotenoid cleavage dioxygenase-like enzyme
METEYTWRWVTTIEAAEPGGASIHYDQSQLNGAVLSLAKLRKGASNHVPDLSDEGRLHRRTLQLMDGNTSLEEISRRLVAEFPLRFSRWQQALTYAGALSQEYGR